MFQYLLIVVSISKTFLTAILNFRMNTSWLIGPCKCFCCSFIFKCNLKLSVYRSIFYGNSSLLPFFPLLLPLLPFSQYSLLKIDSAFVKCIPIKVSPPLTPLFCNPLITSNTLTLTLFLFIAQSSSGENNQTWEKQQYTIRHIKSLHVNVGNGTNEAKSSKSSKRVRTH